MSELHPQNTTPENRPIIEQDTTYWRSLEQWNDDPEFKKMLQTEFISSPLRDGETDGDLTGNESEDGFVRREFLKIMGASIALSAAGCIRRPVQKIVPYNKQPEEVTLGVPNFYTSTFFDGSEGLGVLIKTREGRPIKVEGNPDYPLNKGALSCRSQASILSLYDPERLRGPKKNLLNEKRSNKDTIDIKWEAADEQIVAQLKKGGVHLLTGVIASPSTQGLISDFAQAFKAEHTTWEPLSYEEVREGQKASYGDDLVPFYRFDKAQMIVSIDADFLGTWMSPVMFSRQFSAGRKDIKNMSKMVSFDSTMSLTGANADIRIRIKPSQQLVVVMSLINELVERSSYSGNTQLKTLLSGYVQAASELKMESGLLKKIAQDLWANKGKSLVVAGGLEARTENAMALQVAVNLLNSILENDGKTVLGKGGNPSLVASSSQMHQLIEKIEAGSVKTLILHRTNPAYSWFESQRFVEALKKVEMVISTTDRLDEVGKNCHFVLPDNHALETWGDAEFVKGLTSIQQPTIRPMYDTRSFQLSLMTWAYLANQGPKRILDFETYYDYLRNFWKTEIFPSAGKGKSFDDFWATVLQTGFVGETMAASSSRSFKSESLANIPSYKATSGFELALYTTIALGDGTLSNVSWLQETPDPITKIVWDNYLMVSLATAEKNNLKQGNIVEVSANGKKIALPTHIQPGLHDDVLAIAVGYGRTAAGKVGNGIGQNAYLMASIDAKTKSIYTSGLAATMKKTGRHEKLATTQDHSSMEGRQIVVEATLKDYLKKEDSNIHKHHIWSLWAGHQYNGHKWGMTVDLNSCTGCTACLTACQSENNIPVVGKKYVMQGREMHWIRVDRYYSGNPTDPQTVFQPVMCQHCDNAPCETVCPVLATVHSSEGLNEMVYNRCVGTRYCSNNCPYKVRRFNWFNYAKLIEKPQHMAMNPDVTPRIRGVMEKCSFCVHRIKEGKNKAKLAGVKLKDGDIKTACQTSCPTNAIVFGDLNDADSEVAKIFKEGPRSYALLEEWHAAPAVRYLSKIRNNDKETATKGHHKDAQKDSASKGEHT